MKLLIVVFASFLFLSSVCEASTAGSWAGQVEFGGNSNTEEGASLHTVTEIALNIEDGGRVTGATNGNKCKILGLVMPGNAAYLPKISFVLSGCSHPAYNRRFSGTLNTTNGGFAVNYFGAFHDKHGIASMFIRGTLKKY